MKKIEFNITNSTFSNVLNNCINDKNSKGCKAYSENLIDPCNVNDKNLYKYTPSASTYNQLLSKIINHFNYIITLNKETKNTFSNKINNDKLNKRYIYYDSLSIDYENTWIKKLTFWLYFIVILIYISVFILKNLYKDKIEFLYLFIVIITPLFSEKILHIINYFYKFNILFTNN